MAIKNTSFAKGEAVQKLIEVIARVNNKSVTDDAALQSAIDEVREMFKTDELTECTTAELNTFISSSQLEPGHKYKITDNDNIIVSAKSTSELESYAIGDAGIYVYSDLQFITSGTLSPAPDAIDMDALLSGIANSINNGTNKVTYSEDHILAGEDATIGVIPSGSYYIIDFLGANGAGGELYVNTSDVTNVLYAKKDHSGHYSGLQTISYTPTYSTPGFSLMHEHLTKEEFNNFAYNVAEGDTYTPLQKIILETVGVDEFIGSNSVVSVENIPVTKSTVVATVAAGGAVSFAEGLVDGREVYVIAQNSGTDPIVLTFTDANTESVELAAGARTEFSVINIAGTYYVRVGVDVAAGAADVEEISAEEVAAKFA